MENFASDPSAGTTTGSILVFVNPGWSLGSLMNPTDIASSSWALENASSSGPQFVLDQFTAYVQAALAKLGVAIQNGIVTLQQLIADKITTNVLCVQGTCVTGDELQNLLNKNGVGNSDTTSSASGGGSDTTIASSTPDNGSSTTPSENVSSTPDTDSSNADSTTDISSDSTVPPSSGGGSDATSVTNPPADDSASTPTSAPAPASSDGSSDSSDTSADSGT
jgi:hypothetical protein